MQRGYSVCRLVHPRQAKRPPYNQKGVPKENLSEQVRLETVAFLPSQILAPAVVNRTNTSRKLPFPMPTTLINISNRLPVTVGEKITKSSGGLVAALEGLSKEEYDTKWIGWPGGVVEEDRQAEVERVLIEEHGCTPVFLTKEEADAHYEGFSNSSVWPLLHYMPNYLRYEPEWWEQYRLINQRFADKVLETAKEGDLVWVHDYQLLLLPTMLRKAMPKLRVGFFLHTPFPAYDIFRCHPRRKELVEGMLGADLLGFHTFGYLRHFRSAVLRLLDDAEAEIMHVEHGKGQRSTLGVYPIGINAAKFDERLDDPGHARRQEGFRVAHQGKQIVLSVERMDYTKGILHRIEAVEDFLAQQENCDGVVFIFVSVPSREGVEEYQELREDVESRIGRLNGKYATLNNSPIHFVHGSVEFEDLCAMYSIADVALITPLVDGMNLVAKEFLACQRDGAGTLVLSEFAGAAEELFNALLVNPYDSDAVAESITRALQMPSAERRERNGPMRERVMQNDAQWWAKSFIDDLSALPSSGQAVDESADLRAAERRLAETVAAGKRVALFFDYDGTLREIVANPGEAKPSDELLSALDTLRDRPNVDVTIISGRRSDELEAWLGSYPFRLIAEHGARLRAPGGTKWEQMDKEIDYSWKADLLKLLRLYEGSTPGSFLEEKPSSLVWHYRHSDEEFGTWKASQLAEELGVITANSQVEIRHGKKIVELSSVHVSKGAAVSRILAEKDYEAVLCVGDDLTDETMFALSGQNLVTIKVGDGPTRAKCRVADPAALRRFLAGVLGK